MTPRTIITLARSLYNDEDAAMYRISDEAALLYVNDGLKELSRLAPRFFIQTGEYTCIENQTEQAVTFSDAQAIYDVIRVKNGRAILPMDLPAMNRFSPNWNTETAAEAKNWARYAEDPLRFYIYPKAPIDQVLEVLYVRTPADYTATQEISEVPETMSPALADYVVYRAESRDDEHAVSGRATAHYQSFVQKVTGASGG